MVAAPSDGAHRDLKTKPPTPGGCVKPQRRKRSNTEQRGLTSNGNELSVSSVPIRVVPRNGSSGTVKH